MRHLVVAVLASTLLALTCPATPRPVVSVSSNPTGLTIESQKTGKQMIPGIDIYPDGAVTVRRYDGSEVTKRIDSRAVDRLVGSLVRSRFYTVTEDSFHAEVDRFQSPGTTERIIITDCPIWTVRVRQGRITHSTTFYGLWEMAGHYPKSKQLKLLKSAVLDVYAAVDEKV